MTRKQRDNLTYLTVAGGIAVGMAGVVLASTALTLVAAGSLVCVFFLAGD